MHQLLCKIHISKWDSDGPLRSNCRLRSLSTSYLRFHSAASAWADALPSAARLKTLLTAYYKIKPNEGIAQGTKRKSLIEDNHHTCDSLWKLYKMIFNTVNMRLLNHFLNTLLWVCNERVWSILLCHIMCIPLFKSATWILKNNNYNNN